MFVLFFSSEVWLRTQAQTKANSKSIHKFSYVKSNKKYHITHFLLQSVIRGFRRCSLPVLDNL